MLYCLVINNKSAEIRYFQTRTQVVQFLSQIYTDDRKLESALYALENIHMSSSEKFSDNNRKLAAAAVRDPTGMHTQDHLMARISERLSQHSREQMCIY